MKPSVSGYDDNVISVNWAPASDTGIPVQYNLYYSQFDPDTDITIPALALAVQNLTTTSYSFENVTRNIYYQFAVQAINDVGKLNLNMLKNAYLIYL